MDEYGLPLCNLFGDAQIYQTEERAARALETYNDEIQAAYRVTHVSLSYVNPLSA